MWQPQPLVEWMLYVVGLPAVVFFASWGRFRDTAWALTQIALGAAIPLLEFALVFGPSDIGAQQSAWMHAIALMLTWQGLLYFLLFLSPLLLIGLIVRLRQGKPIANTALLLGWGALLLNTTLTSDPIALLFFLLLEWLILLAVLVVAGIQRSREMTGS